MLHDLFMGIFKFRMAYIPLGLFDILNLRISWLGICGRVLYSPEVPHRFTRLQQKAIGHVETPNLGVSTDPLHPAMFTRHPSMFACHPAMIVCHPAMFTRHPSMIACHQAMFACHRSLFGCHRAMIGCHRSLLQCHQALFACHRPLFRCHRALLNGHLKIRSIHRRILNRDLKSPLFQSAMPKIVRCSLHSHKI